MRKLLALLLAFTLLFSFNGCGQKQSGTQEFDLSSAEWDEIVEAARGTTVTFYGWGGDENRNNWLNTTVADYVKEHYDIALEVVGMDINDILSKLSGEKQARQRNRPHRHDLDQRRKLLLGERQRPAVRPLHRTAAKHGSLHRSGGPGDAQ